MSKLYTLYLKKKSIDKNKYYLFKSGMFYIFIDEDAKCISRLTTLKITNLNNEIVKCGFPCKNIDRYMELFSNLELDIEIVDNGNHNDYRDKIVKIINDVNINELTPIDAFNIICKLKEYTYE